MREINVNFTLKELIRFSGLECSNTSYATFYREIKGAGFKFLNPRKKGVLNRHDRSNRYKFARKCKRILRMKPNLFHSNISFYLDGVSFVFKRKRMHDAIVPKGKIWRSRSEELRLTSKGSKDLPGGKRLHFLVAIAFNRVILAKEYEHMSGQYFSTFVRTNLSKVFEDAKEQKWFVMDNDPSQRSKASKKAINESGATLFAIPPRSPDLNPIENLFHIVKKSSITKLLTTVYNKKRGSSLRLECKKLHLKYQSRTLTIFY